MSCFWKNTQFQKSMYETRKLFNFSLGKSNLYFFCFFKFLYSFFCFVASYYFTIWFHYTAIISWMLEGYWYGIVLNLDLEKVDELLLKMHLHCFIYMNVSKILPPFCLYSSSLIRRKSWLSYSLTMIQLRSEKSIDWNTLCSWRIHSTNIKFK